MKVLILCNKIFYIFVSSFYHPFFMGSPFYVADKWEMYSYLVMDMW